MFDSTDHDDNHPHRGTCGCGPCACPQPEPAETSTPVPCPKCGHPDDWRQVVRLLAEYELVVQEDGTYRFGPMLPDVENEETLRYECGWCNAEADLDTIEAIEERIR